METNHRVVTTDAPPGAPTWERPQEPLSLTENSPHHVAARGFAQMFSLNPVLAIFIIVLDAMVSAVDVTTLGVTVPILWLIAAIVSSVVIFMGQKKWGGDDAESSFIKALMVGFLVALPTPLPSFLTVPSAIVGTVQMMRRKEQ